MHKSAGGGLFFIAAILQLNFEVSHSIDEKKTRFHFGTGFSFLELHGPTASTKVTKTRKTQTLILGVFMSSWPW